MLDQMREANEASLKRQPTVEYTTPKLGSPPPDYVVAFEGVRLEGARATELSVAVLHAPAFKVPAPGTAEEAMAIKGVRAYDHKTAEELTELMHKAAQSPHLSDQPCFITPEISSALVEAERKNAKKAMSFGKTVQSFSDLAGCDLDPEDPAL